MVEEPRLRVIDSGTAKPENPFADLESLRCPQDYEDYMAAEAVTQYPIRLLKESMHLRINPDPAYTVTAVYLVDRGKGGRYFIHPKYRDALGPWPRCCNLHTAVDGHGRYFILQVKQRNPGQDENLWYETARMVAAAAMQDWVKVTKPEGGGWGFIPVQHKMFIPTWPEKPSAAADVRRPHRRSNRTRVD